MHRISPCPFNTVNGTYPGSQSPPTGHIPLSAVFNLVQVVTPPEVGAQFRTLASVRSLSVCEVRGSRRRMKIMVFWDGETAGSSQTSVAIGASPSELRRSYRTQRTWKTWFIFNNYEGFHAVVFWIMTPFSPVHARRSRFQYINIFISTEQLFNNLRPMNLVHIDFLCWTFCLLLLLLGSYQYIFRYLLWLLQSRQ